MPLYMDRHEVDDSVTPFDIAQAHARDTRGAARVCNVDYITYWFDHRSGAGFCLVEGPSAEAVEAVHREAHGLIGTKVIEVDRAAVESFLGSLDRPLTGEAFVATAFRAILFTDVVGSTELTQKLGDAGAMRVIRAHDAIVNDAIRRGGGHRVKHTGDGVMASFTSVSRAGGDRDHHPTCGDGAEPLRRGPVRGIRAAVSAGEPVTEGDDLFGAAVQLAARVCSTCGVVACWCRARCASCASARAFSSRTRVLSRSKASRSRSTSTRWIGPDLGSRRNSQQVEVCAIRRAG